MNETYDWKAKLKEAETIAEAAKVNLEAANDQFKQEMEKVEVLVAEAIKLGGKDAEQQWLKFRDNFYKGIKDLVNDLDDAIHKFSHKINWVKNRYWIIAAVVVVSALLGWLLK